MRARWRQAVAETSVLELFLSEMPEVGYKWNDDDLRPSKNPLGQHGELSEWCGRLDVAVRPVYENLSGKITLAPTSLESVATAQGGGGYS